ncbi:Nif3-like dinuclear metal center hexameric protein [Uliginosibacterium sp. H1]|uniref:Nif3-like dinuclear metal center hexameric protein n=1 Tax=Uliginosibacterium sp. H1 TaxID=3114757 RepID=UPI003FCE39EC
MERTALRDFLDKLFDCARVKDYCPNGLQVEGCEEVRKVVCGVTASQALIDHAIAEGADTIIVHHGYFWRGEDSRVLGIRKQRLAALLAHDINLFAFHLPLDLHPELGNNVQLAQVLDWRVTGRRGEQDLVFVGEPEQPLTLGEMQAMISERLGREALLVGDAARLVRRLAWCTGGAQGYLDDAVEAGVDLYVSGEISEKTVHLARESGVAYIAAGHHATERYGIRALAQYLRDSLGLDAGFVDIDNPA